MPSLFSASVFQCEVLVRKHEFDGALRYLKRTVIYRMEGLNSLKEKSHRDVINVACSNVKNKMQACKKHAHANMHGSKNYKNEQRHQSGGAIHDPSPSCIAAFVHTHARKAAKPSFSHRFYASKCGEFPHAPPLVFSSCAR
jgi:ribosomal protein S21